MGFLMLLAVIVFLIFLLVRVFTLSKLLAICLVLLFPLYAYIAHLLFPYMTIGAGLITDTYYFFTDNFGASHKTASFLSYCTHFIAFWALVLALELASFRLGRSLQERMRRKGTASYAREGRAE
jgi:hypothetical protein